MSGGEMGRPLGALRGRTEQANELALWLRKMTVGKGVRTLEEDFSYSTTSWSEFRSGSRLLSEELLRAVVEKYIRQPQMGQRQLAEGLRLLEAARRAEAVLENGVVLQPLPVRGPQQGGHDVLSQALLRLDDARLRQIEALQKLAASERRRIQLEDMVSVLQERCTLLEGERDRAREDARADFERELEMSREYRRQADEKLEQARRAEEKAFQLRLAAEQQVTQEQLVLSRIGETVPDDPADEPGTGQDGLGLPPLDQIRDVLHAAQEQLDAQDDELSDLEAQIGLDADEELSSRPGLVLLVVPEQLQDNPTPAPGGLQNEQENAPDRRGVPSGADRLKRDLDQVKMSNRAAAADKPTEAWDLAGMSMSALVLRAELLHGLDQVATQDEFAAQLRMLRRRASADVTDSRLAEIAFGLIESAEAENVVRSWFTGEALPQRWRHLHPVLAALGANLEEILHFQRAWTTVGGGPERPMLVSSVHPFMRLQRLDRDPLGDKVGWITDAVGFLLMAALSAAFGAAIEADPGPPILKMIFCGIGLLLLQIGLTVRRRTFFGVYAFLTAVAVLNVGGNAGGRWLAENIGLI
ncbi:hypothetical protein ACFV9E_11640 [Streptomyces sp. NPDC059835]|uniref:hypothetical protein n=1 Tax=Streptomyces sp. NPDC059835 TaxID=3346967 RepID=UPI003648B98E